jgi:hypothetical protein
VTGRYVVSTRRSGLGDRLVSLAAAWRFARNTGRTLVADWRFSAYALDGAANLFTLCFEGASSLAGVPFVGDDSVGRLGLPGDPRRTVLQAIRHRVTGCRRLGPEAALRAIREGRDVKGRAILLDACLADGSASVEETRGFLAALRPVAHVANAVSAFRSRLGDGPIIGVHVRHGNGGNILGHARYWPSLQTGIDRCVAAVRRARARLGSSAIVMLCTDSIDVERALAELMPHVITRPKMHRYPGAGELHTWRGAGLVRDDAMIEMLLLAESDVLVRYPPGSFFSLCAAVMKRHHERPLQTVGQLACPWDPGDALSAAVLF